MGVSKIALTTRLELGTAERRREMDDFATCAIPQPAASATV
tara:strand:- start:656 stop:778 length:123 start_codon:yes stop_codon:yes gene_type:complete